MTAASAPLNTQIEEIGTGVAAYPMVDNVIIYKGTLVAITTAGLARPAANTAGMVVVGIARETVDNTITGHAAGAWPPNPANWITVSEHVNARLNLSGSPAQSNLGQPLYVVDDNTVQLAPTTNGVIAGSFDKRESATVGWVRVGAPSGNALQQIGTRRKIAVVTLTGGTDTAGGLGAWQNPEAGNISIERATVSSEGTGGVVATSACTADIGTTATNATTLSDNLIDGVDIHTALGTWDNLDAPGSNGKARQSLASGKWITFSTATGASAGFVGEAFIEYIAL